MQYYKMGLCPSMIQTTDIREMTNWMLSFPQFSYMFMFSRFDLSYCISVYTMYLPAEYQLPGGLFKLLLLVSAVSHKADASQTK